MSGLNKNSLGWWHRPEILLWSVIVVLWGSGCASNDSHNSLAGATETLLPKLTSVVTGPTGTFLTNGNGFQAEFTISFDGAPGSSLNLSGQVFAKGGKLRFEAVTPGAKPKHQDEFGVVWDAAALRGYVFSEALQGFAPINGMTRFTNLTEAFTGSPEQWEGHLVGRANVNGTASEGRVISLQLLRAQDLGNLPVQVRSLSPLPAFTLTLTKIRPIVSAEELFVSPDGFTKYDNETALVSELSARLHPIPIGGSGHTHSGEAADTDWQSVRRKANAEAP
jgi:hypothetical protein